MITFNTRLSTQRSRRPVEISEPALAQVNVIQYGDFECYAEDLGLAMARFTAEMDDEVYLPAVRAHVESGLADGVQGAPAFVVNGQIVDISCGLGLLFEATENAIRRWRDAPLLR